MEKIQELLKSKASGDGGLLAEAAAAKAGKDPELEWVAESDKEVLVEAIKKGELKLEAVRQWRQDITAEDVA